MKLEEIQRADFPAARRGYDRAAVDAHLAELAAEFERLEEDRRRRSTLAGTAGERVSSVLEVAETQAAQITAEAREEAQGTLRRAQEAARLLVQRAQSSVEGLIGESEDLRQRVSEIGRDLVGAEAVSAPHRPAQITAETEPAIVPEPEPPDREIDPTPVIVPEPSPEPAPEPTPDPVPEPMPSPTPLPTPAPQAPLEPVAGTNGANGSAPDDAGARLVAMKMALDGASREEIAEHLGAAYKPARMDDLLEDVLSRTPR